ncbi:MAG: AAA family ATPase [Chloroflexales bacterium]
MASLRAYLAEDRARAAGMDLPDRTCGAALFADISGFTPLTEALTQALGPRRGIEALTDQINAVYAALGDAVARWRGSIIGFAGDAITCWFDAADGPAAARAAACALDLQAAMVPFADTQIGEGPTVELALKVAIAAGPARRFVIGDPAIQQLDVLAGDTLARMAAGEVLARAGEVLLDEAMVAALGARALIGQSCTDEETGERFALLRSLIEMPAVTPWAPVALPAAALRPWVLPAVWEREQAGLGTFLTELRPAVALFLRFGGLDFDGDDRAGERIDALVRRAQKIFAETGGTLLNLIVGDKGSYLYGAFGAPIAHEDDARRAAQAALALHTTAAEIGLPAFQIGVSQGMMRCGSYGSLDRQTYSVLGDDVNLAARLMSRAAPGETLLSGRVQAALGEAFSLDPRQTITLKGRAAPLPVFALTGLAHRRAIRLQEPAYALPMMGRTRELAHIEACLERALAGQSQIVIIEAEAGMGKSRLVTEVVRLARRHGCTGYGGAAAASGTRTPYLAWRPIIQALLDVDPDVPAERQLQLLARALEERVPTRAKALPLLDLLLDLAAPESGFTRTLAPQDRKGAREALLVDLLIHAAQESRAEGEALLLVLEDAHWLDPLSQELLLHLAQEATDVPLLLVLAARPAEAQSLAPLLQLPHVTTVILEGLDEAELTALVQAKLARLFPARTSTLPEGLVASLAARAQGNPFYVEELLNYLHDRGVTPDDPAALERLDLPDSLHRLVLARIDQLTEHERATLRVASVVGRVFRAAWLPGFVPDLGEPLRVRSNLEQLASIGLTPMDTPDPELAYLFKHVVTQEVAYASLPQTMRDRLHGALADWLEQADPDSPPLDLLAYHYDRSDNLAKRRSYLRRAGEAAAADYANAAAVDYLSRALALVPEEDWEERWALLWVREAVYALLGQRDIQAADLAALEDLAAGHPERAADAALRGSEYHEATGDFRTAQADAERSLALAAEDPARAASARFHLGRVLARQGHYSMARAQIEPALTWVRAAGERRAELEGLLAMTHASDDWAAAWRYAAEALMSSRTLGDRQSEALALGRLGFVSYNIGDYAAALTFQSQALALHQQIGNHMGEGGTLLNLGGLHIILGNYPAAQAELAQVLRFVQITAHRQTEAIAIYLLGECAYHQGDLDAAHREFTRSLGLIRATGDRHYELINLLDLGYVQVARGELETAVALFEEHRALREALGVRGVHALYGQAALACALLARGDTVGAWTQIVPVLSELPDGDLGGHERHLCAYNNLYRVLQAAGDARAPALLARLHARLRQQATSLDDESRHTFLKHVPTNRAIVTAWAELRAGERVER